MKCILLKNLSFVCCCHPVIRTPPKSPLCTRHFKNLGQRSPNYGPSNVISKHESDVSILSVACIYCAIAHRSSSSSSFEGHPLQARHKKNWGRGFILLLPQTAVLPGSDAGSDVIKPASSFVIQNRQTLCSMWCPMYRARC